MITLCYLSLSQINSWRLRGACSRNLRRIIYSKLPAQVRASKFATVLQSLMAFADIVERFTVALMLTAIAVRNLIELSGSEFDFTEGVVLPKSFGWFYEGRVLWTVLYVGPLIVPLRLGSN